MTETKTTTVVIVKGDDEYESGVRRIQAHSEGIVEDFGRIAKAWTNAHTSYWLGAVRVLGDLAVNLNRPSSQRRRTTDLVADAASRFRDITSSVSRAVSDTADVAGQALGRFSDEVAHRPVGTTTSGVTEPSSQPAATTVIWTPPGTE